MSKGIPFESTRNYCLGMAVIFATMDRDSGAILFAVLASILHIMECVESESSDEKDDPITEPPSDRHC